MTKKFLLLREQAGRKRKFTAERRQVNFFELKAIVIRFRSVAAAAASIVTGFTLFPLTFFAIEIFFAARSRSCSLSHPVFERQLQKFSCVEITVKDTDSK